MYCKNMIKCLNGKIKCKILKRHIDYRVDCNKCLKIEPRANKSINKISHKRIKLEKDRDKDLIKTGKCQYCGKYFYKLDSHEVYGGSNRKRSIENRFVALLCRECHQNEEIIQKLKKQYQAEYEQTHSREEFIKIIGKSFL